MLRALKAIAKRQATHRQLLRNPRCAASTLKVLRPGLTLLLLLSSALGTHNAIAAPVSFEYRYARPSVGGYSPYFDSLANAGMAYAAECQAKVAGIDVWRTCANTNQIYGGGRSTCAFEFVGVQSPPYFLLKRYCVTDGVVRVNDVTTKYTLYRTDPDGFQIPEFDRLKNPCGGMPGGCLDVAGNPINIGLKAKVQSEVDYVASGPFPIAFKRWYNSSNSSDKIFFPDRTLGDRWRHSYDRKIVFQIDGFNTAGAVRSDGQVISFIWDSGGFWVPDDDIEDKLVRTTNGSGVHTGWVLTTSDSMVEVYDVDGRLMSISTRSGLSHYLEYSTSSTPAGIAPKPGILISVTDDFGRQLLLTYASSGRLQTATTPAGDLVTYAYGSSGMLASVTYPDTSQLSYIYGESAYMQGVPRSTHLTGIIDENGTRFATFGYDSSGRAISTEHAGGAELVSISYALNSAGNVTSATLTDALGMSRTRQYEFRLGAIRNVGVTEGTATSSRTLDANGNVVSLSDFRGTKTCYKFDVARNLEIARVEGLSSSSSCPGDAATYTPAPGTAQRKTLTTWHSTFRLPTLIDESGRMSSFTHDSAGNVLTRTITDTATSQSRTWTYTYNGFGQVLTEDGPRTDASDITTYTYYSCTTGYQCGQLHTIQNAAGHVTTFDSYDAHGQPTQITDANGVVTTLAYDLRQRLTAQCVNGSLPFCTGGELTSIEYWPTGLLKKVTLPGGEFSSYTYDGAHRLTGVTDSTGNSVTYTLDAMGNRIGEDVRDASSVLRMTHTRVINTLNQLYQDVNAASTGGATTTYGYDNNGNQISVSAPLGRNATQLYDELNRLKQITDPASGLTYFAYDAQDNLIGVTDPKGNATGYAYNGFGDLLATVSPDTGTTTNTYDSAGNLKTSTDARGVLASYEYDALNRVTSAEYSQGGVPDQTITFGYDQGTGHAGLLTSAQDANHAMSWDYDAHGRLTGVGQTVGTVTQSVGYGYANGRLAAMILPSGSALTYGYDAGGRVASITLGSTVILNNIAYEPFGPVKGWSWGNGSTHSRDHDQDGRVTSLANSTPNGINLGYGYDAASRITSLTDSGTNPVSWGYGYDSLDRLTSATGPATYGWSYDANGNRTDQSTTQPSTYTVSASSNRLQSTSGSLARSYAYDAAGNVLGHSNVTLAYNHRNRLAAAQKGAASRGYLYNALGQLIRASGTGGTVHYAYDEAGHLLGEYDGSGALIQETIWLGDTPVATIRPASGGGVEYFYVHADHLDTPRKITRPTDNVAVWRWDADPFGNGNADEDPDGNSLTLAYNLRFPGQLYDPVTELHYNYFRDYDSATGRYVESDPIGISGGIATYTYVGNNPVWGYDALGLAPELKLPNLYDPLKLNTVCCEGGVMKVCLNDPTNKGWKCGIVIDSFDVHERSHLLEFRALAPTLCAGLKGRYAIGYTTSAENNVSELAAYQAQMDYLRDRKREGCLSPDCEREISHVMDQIIRVKIPAVANGRY